MITPCFTTMRNPQCPQACNSLTIVRYITLRMMNLSSSGRSWRGFWWDSDTRRHPSIYHINSYFIFVSHAEAVAQCNFGKGWVTLRVTAFPFSLLPLILHLMNPSAGSWSLETLLELRGKVLSHAIPVTINNFSAIPTHGSLRVNHVF